MISGLAFDGDLAQGTRAGSGETLRPAAPLYTVLVRDGGLEYREYAPCLMAETFLGGLPDRSRTGSEGFRRLSMYLAGNNSLRSPGAAPATKASGSRGVKVAVIAPVQYAACHGGWRLVVTLAPHYGFHSVPMPTDWRVRIVAMPARVMAALCYSGRWSQPRHLARLGELRATLESAGVRPVGSPWVACYNSRFSLPLWRRNEVLIEVAAGSG